MNFEVALLLKSTLLLVFAFLATLAMWRASASARHAVWTVALLALLVLPVLGCYVPESLQLQIPLLTEPQIEHEAAETRPTAPPTSVTPAPQIQFEDKTLPSTPLPAGRSLRPWIGLVWLVGLTIILLRTVRAMLATRSIVTQSATAVDGEWSSLMTDLRHDLGVEKQVDLRIGGDLSPMTWGWRHPKILLPSVAHSWNSDRRRVVLTHELAHVKRRDSITQILVQLTCGLHWYNPLVWFAERRMRTERERACDDYVLDQGASAASYADHLLEIATDSQPGTILATVSMAQPSQLETRLHAILNPTLKRTRMSVSHLAILMIFVFALLIVLTSFQVTTLLSLPLPAPAVPTAPPLEALGPPPIPVVLPVQQPPPRPAEERQLDLPDNEQDLLGYLKALAAKRGIVGVQQPVAAPRTVALVVVLDRSGSMAGSKLNLAKEGTKSALSRLRANDLFGVLVFDYAFRWALEITEARDKEAMRAAIDSIAAVGNTNIYPAMREAFQRLQSTAADSKHIILLSDGQTPAENSQALLSEMINNKITVSTVALTAASNQQLMSDIAMWGRGRAYYVTAPDTLPDVFQREVSLVIGKTQ